MKNFFARNSLYLMTALGVAVLIFAAVNWSAMPVLQRMVSLFFCALVLHLWEEGKFPGGFADLMTSKINLPEGNTLFGELVTSAYVLALAFVPLFFPNVAWLALAPIMLGFLEAIMHVAAIKMFNLPRFYSPGLVTAVFVMLPISIYSVIYVVQNGLMQTLYWLYAILYMLVGLMLTQQIVVRMMWMKYGEFIKNIGANISSKYENFLEEIRL